MRASVFTWILDVFQVFAARAGSAFFSGAARGVALIVTILTFTISSAVFAQFGDPGDGPSGGPAPEVSVAVEYITRQSVEERLQPLGDDLLGDSIDPRTGSVVFTHVDVSLPGNSALEVAIRRTREQGWPFYPNSASSFGDWKLETPRVAITSAGNGIKNFCIAGDPGPRVALQPNQSPFIDPEGSNITESWQHSNGMRLEVPGQGSQHVLTNPKGINWPAGTVKVTKENWALKCGPSNQGANTGLIATAPNGNIYKFDKIITRAAKGMQIGNTNLKRVHSVLLASEVRDVNGNWVQYEYTSDGRLTRIHSNDGRNISIVNGTGGVQSVTANGRKWTYKYTTYGSSIGHHLTGVTLPDGRKWLFELSQFYQIENPSHNCVAPNRTSSVTHPSGVTGTFLLTEQKHLKGHNTDFTDDSMMPGLCSRPNKAKVTNYFKSYSIKSKTLVGPGYPSAKWSYNYPDIGGSWTEVIDPLGQKSKMTYITGDKNLENLPLKSEQLSSTGALMSRVDYTHIFEPAVGETYLLNENMHTLTMPRHQIKTVRTQDGDTFTSESAFNTNQSSAGYSFGNPVQTKIRSNVSGAPRVTNITYEHNLSKWILGLPKRMVQDGREMSAYTYDSFGRKIAQTRYGAPYASLEYRDETNARGVLFRITDAIGRVSELRDYKRGTSQHIRRAVNSPEQTDEYQYVDANGWLMSQKDALNRTTRYTHDNMGRLTQIDPHGTWANTDISYDFPSTGGATQTITKGEAKTTVTYDGMYRTILERTQDISASSNWSSYVNTKYDALGRAIFTSQPSASAIESKGVTSSYDTLGRMVERRENVAPFATTTYAYLSGHRQRVTDPSGAYTDTFSNGFDEPIKIAQPLGVTTEMIRNQWGEMEQLRQHGVQNGFPVDQSQYFTYDDQRRLCRHKKPETRDTLYSYDLAGQLITKAEAISDSHESCEPYILTDAKLITYHYDDLGRLTEEEYAASEVNYTHPLATPGSATSDTYNSYDANGNLTSTRRSNGIDAATWTYAYNDADLLTSETLTLDGQSYNLSYGYNNNAHLTSRSYPSGRLVTYAVDGLGWTTSLAGSLAPSSPVTYASGVDYHSSGVISNLTYGNGQVFSQTLNDRLLPEHLLTKKGGLRALDLNYTYDARGKVTNVVDGVLAANNRTYGYDALGRLTSAQGPWGAGAYTYDALGNLRKKTLGSRTVTNNYDAQNRLASTVDSVSGTRALTHNGRGGVAQLGNTRFWTNKANRATRAYDTAGRFDATYRYDGHYRRIKSDITEGSTRKTFYNVYDISGTLVHRHALHSGEKTDYISGPDGTTIRVDAAQGGGSGNPTYLHKDHLGSASVGTSPSGAVLWTEQYTPYGEKHTRAAANDNHPGFTGHVFDSATGLTYMQARYYDPGMGRFLDNDPVNFIDPDGKKISSSSSVEENEDGTTTTTHDIKFTGALRNTSNSRIGSRIKGNRAKSLSNQIEKSFSGSSVDENGNTTVYNTSADIIVGEATAANERHNIEIVNRDDSRLQSFGRPTVVIAGQKPNYPLGSAIAGGNDIFLNQDIISNKKEFKRTGAHEFGHSAGLISHPGITGSLPNIPVKNLMSQSRHSNSLKIVPAQLAHIVKENGP